MFCKSCGKENKEDAKFCVSCGESVSRPESYVSESGKRTTPKIYASGKNPIVALVLSLLIPGVGQFYNGDTKKGVLMLVGAAFTGVFTGGILWLAVGIWAAFDAYKVASGKTTLWK